MPRSSPTSLALRSWADSGAVGRIGDDAGMDPLSPDRSAYGQTPNGWCWDALGSVVAFSRRGSAPGEPLLRPATLVFEVADCRFGRAQQHFKPPSEADLA